MDRCGCTLQRRMGAWGLDLFLVSSWEGRDDYVYDEIHFERTLRWLM